jgi:branched-subunit amino acid ABC-type transport system permease component
MTAADFLNLLISALLLGGVYAAMSVGMTVIYGVMKIVNLAHAGFLMLGAYFVYELFERFAIDPLLGVILAFPFFPPRNAGPLAPGYSFRIAACGCGLAWSARIEQS